MFSATKRRVDTLHLVGESEHGGAVVTRNRQTGAFACVGGRPGWWSAAVKHLTEYWDAGLIDYPSSAPTIADDAVALTKAGRAWLKFWHSTNSAGRPMMVVLPAPDHCTVETVTADHERYTNVWSSALPVTASQVAENTWHGTVDVELPEGHLRGLTRQHAHALGAALLSASQPD